MDTSYQEAFFDRIKSQLPSHLSLVDELCDLLKLSSDSAYRRIRCETSLSFDELMLLAEHYNISLDEMRKKESNTVAFHFRPFDDETFSFERYLLDILKNSLAVASNPDNQISYIASDIPIFHMFCVPEIAAFRLFVWQNTVLGMKRRPQKSFTIGEKDERINEASRQLRKAYCSFPSREVLNPGTLDSMLHQIEYYWEAGFFDSDQAARHLCDKLIELVNHMQLQAEVGLKFNPDEAEKYRHANIPEEDRNYELYYNEVMHIDNTVMVRYGDERLVYLVNMTLNSIHTRNRYFYEDIERSVDLLMRKSTLISGTSEKERNRVFRAYRSKVEALKQRIG